MNFKLTKHLAAATGALALGASAALAFDPAAMTDAEREAFRAEIRAYLLENPEVLAEAIDVLQTRQAEAEAKGDAALVVANADDLFRDGYSYVGGNPDGAITVVEFIDYRCGYCRKAHAEVAALVSGDPDIRYVVKEFPILGDQSVIASRFAIAALQLFGPEAYAKINAGFYETFRGDVTAETLTAFAGELGLDSAAIMARMDAPEVTRIIADNHLLAQRMKISGTPTFVLGGQMLRGYAPLAALQSIVEDERG
ncbi:MAG: thioredoxin domain-containing protein [Rhodobacteraceae bacterium]|nr:thioredoxin domain-containing protein [Paracoccaceae bacterium]